jgi:hypothetical protein
MSRLLCWAVLSAGIIVAASAGCSKQPAPAKPGAGPAKAAVVEDDEAAEITKAMAMLPDDERRVAEAQKVCPVGGGALGSMGMPYKVTVKGRDVYLCCEGCKDSIEKDPDKYLAKLDSQPAADAQPQ